MQCNKSYHHEGYDCKPMYYSEWNVNPSVINHRLCRVGSVVHLGLCVLVLCSMIRQYDLITHDTLMHFNLFFFERCQTQSFTLMSISKKLRSWNRFLKKLQWLEITPNTLIFRHSHPQQVVSCFCPKFNVAALSSFPFLTVRFVISSEVTPGEL